MSRPWRIEYEGAFYHIFSRGNEGRAIFYGDEDRDLFLLTLGEMSVRFEVDVFAFGTLLWELIAREVPYDGMEPADIKEKVMAEEQLKLPFGTNSVIEQYTSQSHIQFSTKECSRKLTSLIND